MTDSPSAGAGNSSRSSAMARRGGSNGSRSETSSGFVTFARGSRAVTYALSSGARRPRAAFTGARATRGTWSPSTASTPATRPGSLTMLTRRAHSPGCRRRSTTRAATRSSLNTYPKIGRGWTPQLLMNAGGIRRTQPALPQACTLRQHQATVGGRADPRRQQVVLRGCLRLRRAR